MDRYGRVFYMDHNTRSTTWQRPTSTVTDDTDKHRRQLDRRSHFHFYHYLRQVNQVNGRDFVFVRCVCVCVCVCLCVCAQQTGQSDQFKTIKAKDFKFDMHVSVDSPDMNP